MKRLHIFGLLIQPSVASVTCVLILSCLLLGITIITYGESTGILYGYLLGPNSSVELTENSRLTVSYFNEALFGGALLNQILFVFFWMSIGLIVYALINGIGSGVGGMVEQSKKRKYINAATQKKERTTKILFQASFATLWIIYSVVFFNVLLPFSLLSAQIAFTEITTYEGALYALMSIFVILVSMHIHVVMARLSFLRLRLFGGAEDIMAYRR